MLDEICTPCYSRAMLKKRGKVWFSRIRRNGLEFVRSTKCERKKDAQDVENIWKAEMAKSRAGIYNAPTAIDFSAQFLNYLKTRVSPRSFVFYASAWRHITDSPLGLARLDQINAQAVETFIGLRLAQKYTRGEKGIDRLPGVTTVNHDIRTLRRALRLAEDWKLIDRAPRLSLLKGEKERELTIDETTLGRLLMLCDKQERGETPFPSRRFHPEMKSVLPFLMDTGLRAGELCRLDWTDVNLSGRGSVLVRVGKTKNARRTIPLTDRARGIVEALPRYEDCPAVFTRKGKRVNESWMSHQFNKMKKWLKLPDALVLHSARHTFCSNLGRKGASPYVIQKLAGHANITISARYTHTDAAQLEAAVGLLEA